MRPQHACVLCLFWCVFPLSVVGLLLVHERTLFLSLAAGTTLIASFRRRCPRPLINLTKGPVSACVCRIHCLSLGKFCDVIFIPVQISIHLSMFVYCNASASASSQSYLCFVFQTFSCFFILAPAHALALAFALSRSLSLALAVDW